VAIPVVNSSEVLLSRGDADRHAEALTKRACGNFDARRLAVLRMSGGVRSPLAELLELRHGQVVAGEVERTVEEGRGVAVGEDEAVAINPLRIRGIMLHDLVVEQIGDGCAAKRGAGVAGFCFFNGVDGEEAEGIDGELV